MKTFSILLPLALQEWNFITFLLLSDREKNFFDTFFLFHIKRWKFFDTSFLFIKMKTLSYSTSSIENEKFYTTSYLITSRPLRGRTDGNFFILFYSLHLDAPLRGATATRGRRPDEIYYYSTSVRSIRLLTPFLVSYRENCYYHFLFRIVRYHPQKSRVSLIKMM